jgi:hypothetical protein
MSQLRGSSYKSKTASASNEDSNTLIRQALIAILKSPGDRRLRPKTVADRIAIGLVRQALGGNVQAVKEIADRTQGRAPVASTLDDKRVTLVFESLSCRVCSKDLELDELREARAKQLPYPLETRSVASKGSTGDREIGKQIGRTRA